ncbi:MAG: thymidylate synthase [Methanosarcinales archaeon]|nr:MAG: thymidylate synthase [Methanosarcinales archaeon]
MELHMKLLILYGGSFGERVIRNLVNDSEFCKSCDPLCTHCKYERYCYAENIIGTIKFPAPETLPDFIDDPAPYIPTLPSADIMIATEIHPDILMELPTRLNDAGIKGLIVPIEQSKEVSSGLAKQVEERCNNLKIESAFPKPFCSLNREKGLIGRFISEFKIGTPILNISVTNKVISAVTVKQSAPCGSTWFVAKKLVGAPANSHETIREIVAEAHHSYPCTADMTVDRELKDTILHVAGYLIRSATMNALSR